MLIRTPAPFSRSVWAREMAALVAVPDFWLRLSESQFCSFQDEFNVERMLKLPI